MLTPLNEDGTIDYDGVSALTEYYIESGAGGLFTNCLSSEMYELSEKERLELTAHVVKTAAGSVPVFSTGTFGGKLSDQADFINKLYDTGASAIVIITGILAGSEEPDNILGDRIHKLLELTGDTPLGFYECPVPYKRLLQPAQLKEFVSTGRVTYYKDTSLSIDSVKEKLAAAEGYPFQLYDAYMVNAVASLRAGGAGLSCIQGNFIPELIVWICDNFDNPDLQEEVKQAQQFLTDNMDVMHEAYPAAAKYFLQKRRFPITMTTRGKSGNLTIEQKRRIDELFDNYQALQNSIGISQNLIV